MSEPNEAELIKWYLTELSCQEPHLIDSNDLEIYGEDEEGLSGVCTVKITEIADKAYKRIEALEKENAELREVLQKLISLKHYKDANGKTSYYRERQPKAWARANEVLK